MNFAPLLREKFLQVFFSVFLLTLDITSLNILDLIISRAMNLNQPKGNQQYF